MDKAKSSIGRKTLDHLSKVAGLFVYVIAFHMFETSEHRSTIFTAVSAVLLLTTIILFIKYLYSNRKKLHILNSILLASVQIFFQELFIGISLYTITEEFSLMSLIIPLCLVLLGITLLAFLSLELNKLDILVVTAAALLYKTALAIDYFGTSNINLSRSLGILTAALFIYVISIISYMLSIKLKK